jgi:hypothetical protein
LLEIAVEKDGSFKGEAKLVILKTCKKRLNSIARLLKGGESSNHEFIAIS